MRIALPTSARLQNIEAFSRKITEADDETLTLCLPRSYFSVHPIVLSAVASAGVRAIKNHRDVVIENLSETPSTRYLKRMGLFDLLEVETGITSKEKEESGRFVPLQVIRSGQQLSDFIVQLAPLFHADDFRQAEPIQYILSELVRNTLEHAGAATAAVVSAQVYPRTGVVAIGVADCGAGIRKSLARSYPTDNDLSAIQLAMQPGVTGKTRRRGGTADNAGAGLFFCKSMALTSRNHMVLHSGSGLFKLLKARSDEDARILYADPTYDRATRRSAMPVWPGTMVGIDVDVNSFESFSAFMDYVRHAYNVDVQSAKRAETKKKARFQ